jgi:EmrB/QacA subfamily drug resistance transporter
MRLSPARPGPAPPAVPQRAGYWPLAVIASAHLMAILDTTVMFIALPSIQHGLGMTVTGRQWIVTAYTVTLAGFLLLGGRLADRFGARRTLLIGVAGFACASAVGGASADGVMIITARAVQGAFAALLVSSTKSLLVTVYSDEDQRARVMGIFTATLTIGMAAGLVLGGVLTSELGWRWCLYVNVAVSLIAIVGGLRVLPSLPGRAQVQIDLWSALLGSAGMAALVYGLGEASSLGWSSGQITGSLAAAAVALSAFAARQIGHPDRLLPLRVVLDRNRGWAMTGLVVNGLSTFGMMLILTYQLQAVMGYTALQTGLALIPFALAGAAGSALIAPLLMVRIPPRWLIAASIVTEAGGLIPLIWLTPASRYLPLILTATIIEGLGTGVAGPATLNTALTGVLPSDTGAAGAGTSAASQLGSSIGAALLNTIAAAAAASYLTAHPSATTATGTVHGFTIAMAWGAAITLAAAVPIMAFVNARKPPPKKRTSQPPLFGGPEVRLGACPSRAPRAGALPGETDFRAFRSGAASAAAGERTPPSHCRRQFHRSLDTLLSIF